MGKVFYCRRRRGEIETIFRLRGSITVASSSRSWRNC